MNGLGQQPPSEGGIITALEESLMRTLKGIGRNEKRKSAELNSLEAFYESMRILQKKVRQKVGKYSIHFARC